MARERKERRFIVANPDEPKTGDFEYSLYDKAHPTHGDPETIAYMKKGLRGLRGERLKMTFNGSHIDEDGTPHRFRIQRTFNYRNYTDVFGPGSAYASAIHAVRDKYSNETLVTYSIAFDILDEEDEEDDDGEDEI